MGNIEFKIDSKNDSKLHSKKYSRLHSMFYNMPIKNMVIFTNDNLTNRLSSLNIILMQFVCIFGFNWLLSYAKFSMYQT